MTQQLIGLADDLVRLEEQVAVIDDLSTKLDEAAKLGKALHFLTMVR